MSDKKRKVPKLRFPGFTDAWEQRKVSEIFKLTRGQVLPVSKTTEKPRGLSQYPVYSSQTKNDGLMGYYSEYLFDTAITWTTDGANAGTVKYREGKFYSTNVNGVLISENGYANNAVAEIINQVAWKYVSKVGNPKLMNNVMGEILIKIPSSTHEQDRISLFLLCLDSLISLHQRKLDNVKMLKKSLLQKLFPKDGEKIPELRFPGFTDDWEQRKVGEFLTESRVKGSNGKMSKKLTVKLWGKGVVEKNTIYRGSEATQYYTRFSGQFIYGKLDFLNQAFGIVPEELDGYESTLDSPAFDVSPALNKDFFLDYVSREQFYLVQGIIANGSRKAKRIHSDTFFEMPILLPEFNEQKVISDFTSKFDSLISLHQRKLDHLKELKKGLLQQMFV